MDEENIPTNSKTISLAISSATPLLDSINSPSDLKKFSISELKQLASELRDETIRIVSQTGGHLGAGLGVIELTCALHCVFITPADKLIWDVGHQSYPHKILTGRRDKMLSIRKAGGLSGFTKRSESEFDPFGAGHSSTSISAALGFVVANRFNQQINHVIAVIGDGAMSAGMAFEAMNNAGALGEEFFRNSRLVVVLNDNEMSIAKPTGAMSRYFSRLVSSKSYLKIRSFSKKLAKKLPESLGKSAIGNFSRKFEKAAKEWWMGGNIFEELGFYYIGPLDGHDLDNLVPVLENIRDSEITQPVLIHCITEKGHGLNSKMPSSDKLHAVAKFDPETGEQIKSAATFLSYSKIFGKKLTKLAENDEKILAITAAMPTGTGLDLMSTKFPNRVFDVGIAEQHAVTFSAALACEGLKPFCAIYSTFLQRAYDQVVHDVALQSLPVRFIIDRAGFVGADGPTHAGSFDISYLINLPGIVLMAPADGQELVKMLNTAATINNQPSALRFPRGEADCEIDLNDNEILPIGKGRIILQGSKVAILSYGAILANGLKVAQLVKERLGFEITIADARFAKPLDYQLLRDLAKNHQLLITLEEGAMGGFSAAVHDFWQKSEFYKTNSCRLHSIFMVDNFIEQNSIEAMQNESGIGVDNVFEAIFNNLK